MIHSNKPRPSTWEKFWWFLIGVVVGMFVVFTVDEAWGQTAYAHVRVVDGDTIGIKTGVYLRLAGIDAPETEQDCNGIQAGRNAKAFLIHLIDNKPVSCTLQGTDKYGRFIATCLNHEGFSLNRMMVDAGWAWAYRKYAIDYVPNEERARAQKLGVHGMDCTVPWLWREQHRKPVPFNK